MKTFLSKAILWTTALVPTIMADGTPWTPCNQIFYGGLVYSVWDGYTYVGQTKYPTTQTITVANSIDCMSICGYHTDSDGASDCSIWSHDTSQSLNNCYLVYGHDFDGSDNPWTSSSTSISGFFWGLPDKFCSDCSLPCG